MKKDNKIKDEDGKKGIIIILIAIAVVIGLIALTAHLSKTDEQKDTIKKGDTKTEIKKDEDLSKTETTSNVVSVSNKEYVIRYLDIDGNQLGKTQKVSSLDDRVNEKAPKIDGMRFVEWVEEYSEEDNVYYYVAFYRENVELIEEDQNKVVYKTAASHYSNVIPVEEKETENPTYDVEVGGEIPEYDEISEDITISEEYIHILALRFYAPEDVTKEDIENMIIRVYATNSDETISEDQYSYNGEDQTKTGRELLSSTDEEYENGIFYFDYYQETDTKTNTTIEVYWGNDPDANEATEPKEEYIEVYNINLDNVENSEQKPIEETNEDQGQE